MEKKDYVIEVSDATVRFNMASEQIDNLKEYFIKMVRGQLMFQEFLALQSIDFNVRRGEAWGIIGTNGSGKSTLLKLICGILKPYKGSVNINGTIAPLIELGAGFDGNLTAKENIFLNGTLLGHSKRYMQEHFDEIVDFAELKDFLDMPIKNYSSGMAARLGFSIATMVSPDILIVDEALSVGDKGFAQKCIDKMKSLKKEGKTIVFISHSLPQVRDFCDTAMWIEGGMLKEYGEINEVCDHYATYVDYYNSLDNESKKKERDLKFEKRIIPNNHKKGFFSKLFG